MSAEGNRATHLTSMYSPHIAYGLAQSAQKFGIDRGDTEYAEFHGRVADILRARHPEVEK